MNPEIFARVARVTKNLPLKYFLIAVLPLTVLLFTPISNFVVLQLGEKILLETLPVDPRDLLRGDYVVLEYRISNIDSAFITTEIDEYRKQGGDTVYVSLRKYEDGISKFSGISLNPPAKGVFLKARIVHRWTDTVRLDYGLGAYYVPEGTGRELERAINNGKVLADVRVLRGRGVIKKLEVSDERSK